MRQDGVGRACAGGAEEWVRELNEPGKLIVLTPARGHETSGRASRQSSKLAVKEGGDEAPSTRDVSRG